MRRMIPRTTIASSARSTPAMPRQMAAGMTRCSAAAAGHFASASSITRWRTFSTSSSPSACRLAPEARASARTRPSPSASWQTVFVPPASIPSTKSKKKLRTQKPELRTDRVLSLSSEFLVLPIQFEAQLDLARQPGRCDLTEGVGATDVAAVLGDRRGGGTGVVHRQPLGMVERVDRVGAELYPFAESVEVLRQRQVGLVAPGQPERRAAGRAVGAEGGRLERGRVEPERELHLAGTRVADLIPANAAS